MNRRKFLTGTMAGAAGLAAFGVKGSAQVPAAGQRGSQGTPAPGRGRGPAQVAPEKLARIGMMTLNHSSILKLPWNATPSESQTLALFDLPQFYVDTYGCRNVEFQHGHLAQGTSDPDPEFFREFKAKFDAVGSKANQINIEIGVITNLTADARATWLARARKWVDAAPILGVKRLMLNQTGLNEENKAGVASVWKEIQDYARPKGIMISAEPRWFGPNEYGPPAAHPARARYVWGFIEECAAAAGGYSNLDFGGTGRFLSQQELHDAIKGTLKSSAGSMHVKSSPDWDLGLAVKYAESLGFKGLYTIEVTADPAIRIVYNTVLANLA